MSKPVIGRILGIPTPAHPLLRLASRRVEASLWQDDVPDLQQSLR